MGWGDWTSVVTDVVLDLYPDEVVWVSWWVSWPKPGPEPDRPDIKLVRVDEWYSLLWGAGSCSPDLEVDVAPVLKEVVGEGSWKLQGRAALRDPDGETVAEWRRWLERRARSGRVAWRSSAWRSSRWKVQEFDGA